MLPFCFSEEHLRERKDALELYLNTLMSKYQNFTSSFPFQVFVGIEFDGKTCRARYREHQDTVDFLEVTLVEAAVRPL